MIKIFQFGNKRCMITAQKLPRTNMKKKKSFKFLILTEAFIICI